MCLKVVSWNFGCLSEAVAASKAGCANSEMDAALAAPPVVYDFWFPQQALARVISPEAKASEMAR